MIVPKCRVSGIPENPPKYAPTPVGRLVLLKQAHLRQSVCFHVHSVISSLFSSDCYFPDCFQVRAISSVIYPYA